MTTYPENTKFKYPWRTYQQRVLDELQEHLEDEHLHIIAPPGSGKTVLGLEVAVRLNKPTLILAPTIAIRNQWIQRFCELFLQTTIVPDWISRDIRNPEFITAVTYQGLHAACSLSKNRDEDNDSTENQKLDAIVAKLRHKNIKTIVVDEAHHLKNEWWQTLIRVKERLRPVIVGLTATPPYDVSGVEWQRYLALNGPVDTEISVPELVIEGDLCPHQDYVHFTFPTEKENRDIVDFRQHMETLFQKVKTDETLMEAIRNHPIWANPVAHLDRIYTNLQYYAACLIFLHSNEQEVPETHLEVIGDKNIEVPEFNYHWAEVLLDFYLFREKEHFEAYEEHRQKLENRLRRYGALERRQISFLHNLRMTNLLTSSIAKLDGIKEIVDFEYRQLGKELRLVVLTDYIRKEFFADTPENKLELNKIGVIPVFEKLRRENTENKKIGVLTGSMVIIPKTALPMLEDLASGYGIKDIRWSAVPFDHNYIVVHQAGPIKHDIVHMVTLLFREGEIEVLIGTKSLLGEGWDAPAINALILASFVGSFVLSNQMRGRAIRTQKGNPGKTGNIWHLACIDPTAPDGGDDFTLLKRRFRSFVGVSFREEPGIENGIGRLDLPEGTYRKADFEEKNAGMFACAGDRKSLKQGWASALKTGVSLVEEIEIPFPEKREYKAVKSMYFNRTIINLTATLGAAAASYLEITFEALARVSRYIRTPQQLHYLLAAIGIGAVLFFGRRAFIASRLYLKYRDIAKDMHQIGEALLNTLVREGSVHGEDPELKVETTIDRHGTVFCHLKGGTTFEKSTFINALQEIVAPIDNPRYIIIRKSIHLFLIRQQDYHSVPELIGRNKKLAGHFRNQWQKFVGACDLVYTRTLEGRKLLLRSRIRSLAAQFENRVEHVNKWK